MYKYTYISFNTGYDDKQPEVHEKNQETIKNFLLLLEQGYEIFKDYSINGVAAEGIISHSGLAFILRKEI